MDRETAAYIIIGLSVLMAVALIAFALHNTQDRIYRRQRKRNREMDERRRRERESNLDQ